MMISPRLSISCPLAVLLTALLMSMLNACAGKPQAVSTSLQSEPVAIEVDASLAEPPTEPVMQPEIKPVPRAVAPTEQRSPFAREDVLWIQQRLQDLGYYEGAIDGAAGRATREAIEAYQQDQGVTPDGKPTADLREFMWRNGG